MDTQRKISLIKHLTILGGALVLAAFFLAYLHFKDANTESLRHDLEDIRRTGVLTVIIEKYPDGFLTGSGNPGGLQVQMIRQYAAWAGIEQVVFKEEGNLSAAMDTLLRHGADLLAWNIPVYAELKETIAYTVPVFTSRQVLVQRKATEGDSVPFVRNQLDLAGQTVYLQPGSPYRSRLEGLAQEIGDTIYIRTLPNAQLPDLLRMLQKGDIDFTVADEFATSLLTQDLEGLDCGTAISFAQNYSWAVNLESIDLQESLDEWLTTFLQSPEYRNLYKQYMEKQ